MSGSVAAGDAVEDDDDDDDDDEDDVVTVKCPLYKLIQGFQSMDTFWVKFRI